ncbi:hypothetical protein Ocin01_20117 [Orchesella cincta]|uniref:Uncharacterized protein n=1 Tax=Orchesella cincta TaxID=48709 RepID=A0A1D2M0S4_ORCCI|nr:hypothetical protein Ocin01_20117 [Orchesella cincta]
MVSSGTLAEFLTTRDSELANLTIPCILLIVAAYFLLDLVFILALQSTRKQHFLYFGINLIIKNDADGMAENIMLNSMGIITMMDPSQTFPCNSGITCKKTLGCAVVRLPEIGFILHLVALDNAKLRQRVMYGSYHKGQDKCCSIYYKHYLYGWLSLSIQFILRYWFLEQLQLLQSFATSGWYCVCVFISNRSGYNSLT